MPRSPWLWLDITHCVPLRLLWLWRRIFCSRGWHALDEVRSSQEPSHYLVCDACQLSFYIDDISTAAERSAE